MTLPGIITGQPISGQQLGNAIFQFLPCLPHEGPPGMPRALANRIFPQGFIPGGIRPAAPAYPALVPPAVIPPVAPPVRLTPPANQVGNNLRPRAQPAAPLVNRPINSGGQPIVARSQRVRVRERPGL